MSNKINLDKYYTPIETAKYCIKKTYEIIGEFYLVSDIKEIIKYIQSKLIKNIN